MHESTSTAFPQELLDSLHPGARVAVLTGAGISAASGIPTFRGKDGLWKNHSVQDLATPGAFARDPATVWEWYGWRRDKVRAAGPNAGHRALADLARRVARLDIITQNVDGLHQQADLPDTAQVVELHGSLWRQRCTACGHERVDRSPGPRPGEMPTCQCGSLLRPGVVWFGEQLAVADIEAAHVWTSRAEVFLVAGTSAVVQPAAGLITLAGRGGAYVAEFNLESTPYSARVDLCVQGPTEETLPRLVEALDGHRRSGGKP